MQKSRRERSPAWRRALRKSWKLQKWHALFLAAGTLLLITGSVVLVAVSTVETIAAVPTETEIHSLYRRNAAGLLRYDPKIVPDIRLPEITDGMVPVVLRLPTAQPVVFLTIDDGVDRLPEIPGLLKANNLKASLFLTNSYAQRDPGYFGSIVSGGSMVENHTMTHARLTKLTLDEQRGQICGAADNFAAIYGRRPVLFRPPYGYYNEDTRRAAADCGMRALVYWSAVAEGGAMYYQNQTVLRPGDIVLMHFKPGFAQDLQAFIDAQRAAGLEVDLLENWL